MTWVHGLHLLAAIVWVGGAALLPLAVIPVLKGKLPEGEYLATLAEVGRKFRLIGWVCITILIGTGYYRIWGFVTDPSSFLASRYGVFLLLKLALVTGVLALSVAHDFILGPAVERAALSNDPSLEKKRSVVGWLARLNFLLMLAVVAAAAYLRMGAV